MSLAHPVMFAAVKLLTLPAIALSALSPLPGFALPPPEDPPEEVLRTEIITDARSPLTGEPLTAAEYAALQEQLQTRDDHLLPSDLRELIFLLQLRRVLQLVAPLPF